MLPHQDEVCIKSDYSYSSRLSSILIGNYSWLLSLTCLGINLEIFLKIYGRIYLKNLMFTIIVLFEHCTGSLPQRPKRRRRRRNWPSCVRKMRNLWSRKWNLRHRNVRLKLMSQRQTRPSRTSNEAWFLLMKVSNVDLAVIYCGLLRLLLMFTAWFFPIDTDKRLPWPLIKIPHWTCLN